MDVDEDVVMDIRRVKIRNEDICEKVGVPFVENKMQKVRLRWFSHVKRICLDALARKCENLAMDGFNRGRRKKYWGR